MTRRSVILCVLTLAMAAFAAAAWQVNRPSPVTEAKPAAPEIIEPLVRSHSPVLGPEDAPVTIVEFFDYNCPFCRQVKPEVQALLADDPNIRLVYREWPILGEGSVFAARAALATRSQGKYEEFHWAMMGMQGRAEEASVLRIAEEVGLDLEKLRADMEAPEIDDHIAQSMRLTRALGFSGTPSFVIGDALVPGFVEAPVLAEQVAKARGDKE